MILLDTHIALALIGQTRLELSKTICEVLESQDDKFVSAASIWEVAIKFRSKKLSLAFPLPSLVSVFGGYRCQAIDVTPADAIAEIDPLPETRDPFDRLLLAQCEVRGWRLLTMDRALVSHPLAWRPS